MVRATALAAGLVVLLFAAFGTAVADDDDVAYQIIEPIQHEAGKVTTVYTLTNMGPDAATYSLGFYVQISGTSTFP